mmetsp:Transcript_5549/g.12137  ORF Transcript_5549/g.12137 Transcript_5549/m.12137 type:complete len:353 (+) Transcript_5549:1690-2748(+)
MLFEDRLVKLDGGNDAPRRLVEPRQIERDADRRRISEPPIAALHRHPALRRLQVDLVLHHEMDHAVVHLRNFSNCRLDATLQRYVISHLETEGVNVRPTTNDRQVRPSLFAPQSLHANVRVHHLPKQLIVLVPHERPAPVRLVDDVVPLGLYRRQRPPVHLERLVVPLRLVAQHPHVRQHVRRHRPRLRLEQPHGLAVPVERQGIVALVLLQRQRLDEDQVGVERIQVDGLLEVHERLATVLPRLDLQQPQRRERVRGVGARPEKQPQVRGRLVVGLVPDEGLRQAKTGRAELRRVHAGLVVELVGLLHLPPRVVDAGEHVEGFSLHLRHVRRVVRTLGQGQDAVVILLPYL